MSPPGVIHTVRDGNLDVNAEYATASAHAAVRLALNSPGQLLGAIHGTVYAMDDAGLRPLPGAHVRVVRGDRAGAETTTRADGTYQLTWIAPGEVVLRATKTGYESTETTKTLLQGDVAISLVLQASAAAYQEIAHTLEIRSGRLLDAEPWLCRAKVGGQP